MTIKVQKQKLLHDDSSDFPIILLNKISTEVWNTVFRSQMVIFQGSIKKKSFISEDEMLHSFYLQMSKD